MGVATARPTSFVEGKGYPSPATHVIGFGYYDGVTDGILKTAGGSVFRFETTGESHNPAGSDLRTFDLSPLPAGVFEQVVSLLSPYSSPSWPVWVPTWKFPTDEIRKQLDEQIDRWLASAGPPAWRVDCHDLTDVVTAMPVGR